MNNHLFGFYVSLVRRRIGWMPRPSKPADVDNYIYIRA